MSTVLSLNEMPEFAHQKPKFAALYLKYFNHGHDRFSTLNALCAGAGKGCTCWRNFATIAALFCRRH
jgi:hypothetical protein